MADNKITLGVDYSTRKLEIANEILQLVIRAHQGSTSAAIGKFILQQYSPEDPVEAAKKYMKDLSELQRS